MPEPSNRRTEGSTTTYETADPNQAASQRTSRSRTRSGGESTIASNTGAGMPASQSTAGRSTTAKEPTFAGRLRERAGDRLTEQKSRATDGIASVAQAIRQSTAKLREERHDSIAEYIDRGAQQLDRLSSYLQQKDAAQLWSEAQRFARRRPGVFVGAAFAAGLVAARFLKSSNPSRQQLSDWRRPELAPHGGA